MLTEKYYGNFFIESSGGGSIPEAPVEPSEAEALEPGTVIIEERTVTTVINEDGEFAASENILPAIEIEDFDSIPSELAITFNGKQYTMAKGFYGFGEEGENGPEFEKYSFFLTFRQPQDSGPFVCILMTPFAGTYTISAKIPDSKGTPKILRITKVPRTVLNQLCRVSKALKSQN